MATTDLKSDVHPIWGTIGNFFKGFWVFVVNVVKRLLTFKNLAYIFAGPDTGKTWFTNAVNAHNNDLAVVEWKELVAIAIQMLGQIDILSALNQPLDVTLRPILAQLIQRAVHMGKIIIFDQIPDQGTLNWLLSLLPVGMNTGKAHLTVFRPDSQDPVHRALSSMSANAKLPLAEGEYLGQFVSFENAYASYDVVNRLDAISRLNTQDDQTDVDRLAPSPEEGS